MNTKRSCITLFLLGLVVLLASCRSTATVRHLVPAEDDLALWRTLAVEPCTVGRGIPAYGDVYFSDFGWAFASVPSSEEERIAREASDMLAMTLSSSSYFTVVPPARTALLESSGPGALARQGVQAVVQSRIDFIDIDQRPEVDELEEWQEKKVDGRTQRVRVVTGREYSVEQRVTVGFTYLVKDLASGTVLASGTLKDSRERTTLIGRRRYEDGAFYDTRLWISHRVPDVDDLVDDIIRSFQPEIACRLMPTWRYAHVALLPAGPGEASKTARRLAKDGLWEAAGRAYETAWEQDGNVYDGCNASLMLEAQGRLDEAVALTSRVAAGSTDRKVLAFQERQKGALAAHRAAINQIEGTTEAGESGKTTMQVVSGV